MYLIFLSFHITTINTIEIKNTYLLNPSTFQMFILLARFSLIIWRVLHIDDKHRHMIQHKLLETQEESISKEGENEHCRFC